MLPNRTIACGDNLDFLPKITTGSVDLIATDPPFNKGEDLLTKKKTVSFSDKWEWNEDSDAWLSTLQTKNPAIVQLIETARSVEGDGTAAYICYMAVRFLEMYRVLKNTGSIYVHIDHTAHAWMRIMLDSIFGKKQFRREIIWWIGSRGGFKGSANNWIRDHDTLLYYCKRRKATDEPVFHKQFEPFSEEYIKSTFRNNEVRGDGSIVKYREYRGRRYYADRGAPIGDVWDDIIAVSNKGNSKEYMGYPTQKPLVLYERLIQASSSRGDLVLDPFCGSGTTLVAAERLERRWIGIDIWEDVESMVKLRLSQLEEQKQKKLSA